MDNLKYKKRWQKADWIEVWKEHINENLSNIDPKDTINQLKQLETEHRYGVMMNTSYTFSSVRTVILQSLQQFVEDQYQKEVSLQLIAKMTKVIVEEDPSLFGDWVAAVRPHKHKDKKPKVGLKKVTVNPNSLYKETERRKVYDDWKVGSKDWYESRNQIIRLLINDNEK